MAEFAHTLIVALAAYRVATDVAWERGPWGVYERLRGAVIQRYGPDDWRSEGVTCPVCVSFWAAPLCLALWLWAPPLVYWLAVAGLVALVHRQSARKEE